MNPFKWSILSLLSGSLFVFAGAIVRILLKNPSFTGPLMGLGVLLSTLGILGLLISLYKLRSNPEK